MLAIMHALTKFRQYSVGNRFKVKTDHNSLKFLMEQKELREWQRLTLGVNLTQQRIRRKSISKRLGCTYYSFWFWISICYCSWAFILGVFCTNPFEQLSGEISTHLFPHLGLRDERLLHTILVSAHLHLVLQKG